MFMGLMNERKIFIYTLRCIVNNQKLAVLSNKRPEPYEEYVGYASASYCKFTGWNVLECLLSFIIFMKTHLSCLML